MDKVFYVLSRVVHDFHSIAVIKVERAQFLVIPCIIDCSICVCSVVLELFTFTLDWRRKNSVFWRLCSILGGQWDKSVGSVTENYLLKELLHSGDTNPRKNSTSTLHDHFIYNCSSSHAWRFVFLIRQVMCDVKIRGQDGVTFVLLVESRQIEKLSELIYM